MCSVRGEGCECKRFALANIVVMWEDVRGGGEE